MNAQFFKTNKDVFLKYFDDSFTLPSSLYYDTRIKKKEFNEMRRIITSKNKHSAEDYINKTMEILDEKISQ